MYLGGKKWSTCPPKQPVDPDCEGVYGWSRPEDDGHCCRLEKGEVVVVRKKQQQQVAVLCCCCCRCRCCGRVVRRWGTHLAIFLIFPPSLIPFLFVAVTVERESERGELSPLGGMVVAVEEERGDSPLMEGWWLLGDGRVVALGAVIVSDVPR
jgi:hypothetical protein